MAFRNGALSLATTITASNLYFGEGEISKLEDRQKGQAALLFFAVYAALEYSDVNVPLSIAVDAVLFAIVFR